MVKIKNTVILIILFYFFLISGHTLYGQDKNKRIFQYTIDSELTNRIKPHVARYKLAGYEISKLHLRLVFDDKRLRRDALGSNSEDFLVLELNREDSTMEVSIPFKSPTLKDEPLSKDLEDCYKEMNKKKFQDSLKKYYLLEGPVETLSLLKLKDNTLFGVRNKNGTATSDNAKIYYLNEALPLKGVGKIDTGLQDITYKKYTKLYGIEQKPSTSEQVLMKKNNSGHWAFSEQPVESYRPDSGDHFLDTMELKEVIPKMSNRNNTVTMFDHVYARKGLPKDNKYYRSDVTLDIPPNYKSIPVSPPQEKEEYNIAHVHPTFEDTILFREGPRPNSVPDFLYLFIVLGIPSVFIGLFGG